MPTTRKIQPIAEAPAPAAGPATVVVEQVPARRMPVLGIIGIAVGSVVLAGALFGGGVAVGVHLPSSRGGFGTSQQGFPGGPNGFGGNGQFRPGQGQGGGPQGGPGQRPDQQGTTGSGS